MLFIEKLLTRNLNRVKHKKDLFGRALEDSTVKTRIGFLPISIWKPNWQIAKHLKKIIGDFGQTRPLDPKHSTGLCRYRTTHKSTYGGGLGWMKNNHKKNKSQNFRTKGNTYHQSLRKNKSTGGWHKTGGRFGHLSTNIQKDNISIFNPHLALMILSAYCPPKAKIYDPFAGGGTRGFIATAMGHFYSGREIRYEEIQRIKTQQKKLKLPFKIYHKDAQELHSKTNHFDFSYTCPPYWNMEVYSAEPGDLSNVDTYPQFLRGIKKVLESVYNALKPGALSVWVIGNFRSGERLLHFNGDLIRKALSVGFVLHDELIFWGAAGQAAMRSGTFVKNRKSVRVHEYIIILKKPQEGT